MYLVENDVVPHYPLLQYIQTLVLCTLSLSIAKSKLNIIKNLNYHPILEKKIHIIYQYIHFPFFDVPKTRMCRPKSDSKKLAIIAQGFFTFFFKQRCFNSHYLMEPENLTKTWQKSLVSPMTWHTGLAKQFTWIKFHRLVQKVLEMLQTGNHYYTLYIKLHRNLDARHTE